MGLIADYAVIEADLLKAPCIGEVIAARKRMRVKNEPVILTVVIRSVKHGEIPRVKTRLGDKLHSFFVADKH